MRRAKFAVPLIAATLSALPSVAVAEPVPPGNSAVTQYTEAYPTAGGPKNAEAGVRSSQPQSSNLSPQTKQRLDARGPDGKAAAELATETAPRGSAAKTGVGSARGGAGGAGDPNGDTELPQQQSGSGLGEVVAQATGTSSGDGAGPLVPLAILAAIALVLFFVWRQRKRPAR